MIILDTCVLIFDAIDKKKLSSTAKKVIIAAEERGQLFCCDISLWEIAMLVQKKRLKIKEESEAFINLILKARAIKVLEITPLIATLSTTHPGFQHYDPADRLIAATTICHGAKLVTCDRQLSHVPQLTIIW